MGIFEFLEFHARTRPYDLAVIHPRGAINYLALRSMVAGVALKLRRHGLTHEATVAVYVTDPLLHLMLVLGLMHNGVRTVSAHPNYDPMPASLPIDTYLCDRGLPGVAPVLVVTVDDGWLQHDSEAASFAKDAGFLDCDAICRIFTSSGTTGTPKAMGHTSAGLAQAAMMRLSREPSFMSGPAMSMMAISSIGGFNTAFHALWGGVPLVMTVDVLQSMRAINLYHVKTLMASPVQVQGIVKMLQGRGARFSSLERLYVAGAALPAAMATLARMLICPSVTNTYGATEVAGGAFIATGTLLASEPHAAGYPQPGVELQLRDEAGTPVPPGTEGIVHLRCPVMVAGYIGDPDATAQFFPGGWFRPGDLGVLRPDGVLLITGRISELINAGGVKVSPQLVDEFLLAQPGIRDAAAFAARLPGAVEQVWAAIVVDDDFDDEALREAAVRRLNSRAPVRFIRTAELPRNAMGKVMRHELAQIALKDTAETAQRSS